jgi:uncharacterized protein YndB with AHSA1/START domain
MGRVLNRMVTAALAVGAMATAGAARAAVTDSSAGGFEVSESVEIAAPAAKVWDALMQPGQWWKGEHSWSGKASNLTLDARAGGCWCEALPGGGAQHMVVIYVVPRQEMRLEGALGPFQFTGATGHLDWKVAEKDGKTTVTWTYDVGGYVKGGIDKLSAPVDGVLGEQIGRLKAYVETGKPG